MNRGPTIGVFDSGFGGLTVLRALAAALPGANYLYLGDTARLPYGSKSAETVTRYTAAAIRCFADRGADLAVIACNTASALALPTLTAASPLPPVGVIEPGARAAANAVALSANNMPGTRSQPARSSILVLATEATVRSHAYATALVQRGIAVHEKACPLLVPLVEEGWINHPVTAQVAEIYLREALREMGSANPPAAILLGCTHYPVLRTLMEETATALIGPLPIVDSAEATAAHVSTLYSGMTYQAGQIPAIHFLATDSPEKFQRLGEQFLHRPIGTVEVINLDTQPS